MTNALETSVRTTNVRPAEVGAEKSLTINKCPNCGAPNFSFGEGCGYCGVKLFNSGDTNPELNPGSLEGEFGIMRLFLDIDLKKSRKR